MCQPKEDVRSFTESKVLAAQIAPQISSPQVEKQHSFGPSAGAQGLFKQRQAVTESRLTFAADQFKSEQKKSNSRVSFLDQAKHEY